MTALANSCPGLIQMLSWCWPKLSNDFQSSIRHIPTLTIEKLFWFYSLLGGNIDLGFLAMLGDQYSLRVLFPCPKNLDLPLQTANL